MDEGKTVGLVCLVTRRASKCLWIENACVAWVNVTLATQETIACVVCQAMRLEYVPIMYGSGEKMSNKSIISSQIVQGIVFGMHSYVHKTHMHASCRAHSSSTEADT
jgi:hypothetical protein